MDSQIEKILGNLVSQFLIYLPNLIGGIVLIGIGLLLGWFAKRLIIQLASVLRLDRLFRRFRWGSGLAKGDIRYAFYNSIGNFAFILIFLLLLTAALDALHLDVLSELIRSSVLFFPKLVIAGVIAILGWLIAGWTSAAMQRALVKENVAHATLVARFVRLVVMLFAITMALVEIDIASNVVIIGFTTIIITLGLLVIVTAFVGGKEFLDGWFHRSGPDV
ncbi:MAG: hypothetical protein IH600_18425 [Bacteroidetes bacterium]|nr:hypothetical protein [Bacteroidota bacterium]